MPQKRRIKLVHIITRLDQGGSSEVVLELASRLDHQTFDVRIIAGQTVEPACDLEAYTRRTGIPITIYPKLRRDVMPLYDVIACFFLVSQLIRIEPDIVHTHSSKAGILGRIAAALAGVPIIVHAPHGHVFYGYFDRLTSWCFVWIERLIALVTDRIVTLTELGKQDHIDLGIGPAGQFTAIPCGIDLSRFTQSEAEGQNLRHALGLGSDEPMALWAGRLVPIKGCDTFLRACSRVAEQCPQARIFIVGDGPLADDLKASADALGLNGAVRFMGWRSDIPAWMWGADIFVLSSLNEGLGRVLLEAMASRKPVVATTVGGVGAIVQPGITGLLVPPEDPEQLAAAMLELLQNPALARRMGEAGYRRALDFYTGDMIEKTGNLYHTLLCEKVGRCAA